jgi:rfaE bifunctional protein nucleotidyltransferase chain/domain
MNRALVVVGMPAGFSIPEAREFELIIMPRLPRSWETLSRAKGFELLASWLIVVGTGRALDAEVIGQFEGCRGGITPGRLPRVVAGIDARACRSRVVTNDAVVAERCAALRRAGKRIVFTNGVFDLFHVGHLRLLQTARAMGDALIVGINSDESARRLKGRARPVVSQFARAQIVSGIRGVDLCAIFSEDDPRKLLRLVHPDLLVKGSEYARAEVVGGRLVEGWGGTVRLIPHVSGWSSTRVMSAARRNRG